MATPPLPSISPAAEKSSESMATPPPPSSIFESMGIPLPLSILRRAEKSSESMDPLALISSVCRHISLMMGMSDASIGSVTASTSFHTCPSTLVDCSDIDDSDPSLSTAAEVEYENETSPASNLAPWHPVNDENLKKEFKEWQEYGPLEGSESSMYEVTTDKGTFFAVKEFPLSDQGSQGSQSLSQLEQEIKLYRQFEHENIVQCIGTEKVNKKLYVFLEIMIKGSVATLYRDHGLIESQASSYTSQILNGLKYLHDKKVIHRDIRCAMILVGESGSVKLDIGLGNAIGSNDANYFGEIKLWMAPEVVRNGGNGSYGSAADIWSVGCTVLEMLTCKPPYSGVAPGEAVARIYAGVPPEIPESLPINAQDFIHKCLQADPQDRPSAAQLLDHPFVSRPPN